LETFHVILKHCSTDCCAVSGGVEDAEGEDGGSSFVVVILFSAVLFIAGPPEWEEEEEKRFPHYCYHYQIHLATPIILW
jgi:hypothetical protein